MEGYEVEPVTDRRPDRDQQEEHGKAHRELRHSRDGRVGPAAEVARGHAEQEAEPHRDEGRAERDLERDLAPVEEPEEFVAAQRPVAAEDEERVVGPARHRPDVRVGDRHVGPGPDGPTGEVGAADEGVVRPVTQEVGQDRRHDEAHHHDEDRVEAAQDRKRVTPEAIPDVSPVVRRRGSSPFLGGIAGFGRRQRGERPSAHRALLSHEAAANSV